MLAVNIDQQFAQLAQLGGGGGDAVDECFGTACVVDNTPQQDAARVVFIKVFVGFEPGGGIDGIDGEFGADIGFGRAFAHHADVAAPAQRQAQGIDQDRFAGPGFAGQYREPGSEFQFNHIDNDKIANGKCT